MPKDLGYPKERSDGQGPHPRVEELFITRREFHDYVVDNRDRQDENKKEILDAIDKIAERVRTDCGDDVDKLDKRVGSLEGDAKKQTIIASTIAGAVAIATALIASLTANIK